MSADQQSLSRVVPSEWRCFHCDEVFTSRSCAAAHFGADEDAEPACRIKMGGERTLLDALRSAEKDASDAWFALQNESTTTAKAFRAMQGRHLRQITAAEQVGFERGLSAAKAHPEELGISPAPDPDTLSEAVGLLRKLLANLDGLDDYMKQPERGGYGVECAVCMNEWLEPADRADMEAARAFLDANTPDPTKGTT